MQCDNVVLKMSEKKEREKNSVNFKKRLAVKYLFKLSKK